MDLSIAPREDRPGTERRRLPPGPASPPRARAGGPVPSSAAMSADARPTTTLAEPLRTRRLCVPKVWGGRALERRPGIALDVAGPVGETWEVFDEGVRSSGLVSSRFPEGTLHGLMLSEREALLGRARPTPDGRFPLVVKFLSATQPLSVQVHPDDLLAPKLGAGPVGKHESWYVVDAEPGAFVYLGLREGVGQEELSARAESPDVVDLLHVLPVRPGDFLDVPGGTLHAIGAGVSILEVQNNVNVTYRLFDWERVGLDGKPRETHIREALLAARVEGEPRAASSPELTPRAGASRGARLVEGAPYGLELLDVVGELALDTEDRAVLYVVLEGRGTLRVPGRSDLEPAGLAPGDTWILPAAAGPHVLAATEGVLRAMRVETLP